MATIPLDEIAPGALIRFVVLDDGTQYLSIRDFIMHACGTSSDHAGDFCSFNEVRDFFPNLKLGSDILYEPHNRSR